jgi:sigma-B regulation protein RsbU (phosphoserine phosphatase)
MNVELLAVHLERLGYEVTTADSGRSALASVAAEPPDVILMDVLMPGMSGLEVLRQIRSVSGSADLPIILVSGLGETEDIVEGLRLGANDYITKPINLPILQARLATQTALKRARDDLTRSARLLQAELARNARQLEMARQVQRSILPQAPPCADSLAIAWCYEPATEVGGDLFDVVPLPDGRTLLFVADAMGHGVQAALVVSTVKATLAAHLAEADDLPRLLSYLDAALGRLFVDRFVTAAACVVDPSAQRLRYALAGHPPLLLAGPRGISSFEAGGLPLGTALGHGFAGGEVELSPGSLILLYSDGLCEAQRPDGSQFGLAALIDRVEGLADCSPAEVVRTLRATLDEFRGPAPLADDLTILAARLL